MYSLMDARQRLLQAISREVADHRVLQAMADVPREAFVRSGDVLQAYENTPLPIGGRQTISQPLVIGLMLQALALDEGDRVLEVGTGSGYQAALLSRLVREVVTVERLPALAVRASRVLEQLGHANVTVHQVESVLGWPEAAPYDAIVVAAAAPSVPKQLVDQLRVGGRMVIPVGPSAEQRLVLVRPIEEGGGWRLESTDLGGCRFVPLILSPGAGGAGASPSAD